MMTRKIGVAALLGALAAGAFSVPARAVPDCPSPALIEFDADVFAYETNYNTATFISTTGSVLTVVGKIVCFGPPFTSLNANMPGTEYTFIWNLKTLAPGTQQLVPNRLWQADYASSAQPGTIEIYEDTTPDSPDAASIPVDPLNALNLVVPEKFVDGTLILSGVIDYFRTQITRSTAALYSGGFNATYHFTGGTLYPTIGNNTSNLTGLWCSLGLGTGQCMIPSGYTLWPNPVSGYSAHPNGKHDTPVPAHASTWGAIKMLYR